MNLIAYLNTPVTPLAEVKPDLRKVKKAQPDKPRGLTGNALHHFNTITTYRAAWQPGEEWLGTAEIERRLGREPNCCAPTLRNWEKQGLLVSRNKLGKNGRPARRKGTEWKWVR